MILRRPFNLILLAPLVLGMSGSLCHAQGTAPDYQRAEQFLGGNLRHHAYVADVTAHWIGKTNRFWYRKTSQKGTEFLLVDPAQSETKPAFDHERLATALSKVTKREIKPTQFPFDSFEFSDDNKSIHLRIDETEWHCTLDEYECKADSSSDRANQYEEASPDKNWIAFVKDFNLFVRYVPTGEIVQLTRDGEAGWDYATEIPSLRPMIEQGTQDVKQHAEVFWSPDSSKLVTYRMDTRSAGRFTNLQFVPPGQLRPKAFSVVYPLPGEVLPKAQPVLFDLQKQKRIDIKVDAIEMQFQGGPDFDWFPDSKIFYYRSESEVKRASKCASLMPKRARPGPYFGKPAKTMSIPAKRF